MEKTGAFFEVFPDMDHRGRISESTASPSVGGSVLFPEDNQIDTGQKPKRKGRTDFDDDLVETGRKAEPQGVGVQDIINNIVNLLGGNVNLHTASEGHPPAPVSPQNRLPFHNRINNRGPPKQGELPFEAIPLEPANINKRPSSPFAPNGIPLPVQIVPQRPGLFPGPRPQGPMTIPLRPPVRVTPPPMPDLFAFGIPKNATEIPPFIPPQGQPFSEATSTTEAQVDLEEDYHLDDDIDIHSEYSNVSDTEHPTIDIDKQNDTVIDQAIDLDHVVEIDAPITVNANDDHDETADEHTVINNVKIDTDQFVPLNVSQIDTFVPNSSVPVIDTTMHSVVHSDEVSASYDEETHYEYEDEHSEVLPTLIESSKNLVSVAAPSSVVTPLVQPSVEVSTPTPVVTPSSVFPGPQVEYEPVPSKPVFGVVESVRTPTPPLQGRPGMVFHDEERPYRGGEERPYRGGSSGSSEPSMFWINKNQMQGDIFELTVNAAQNFGGGGGGATQTFRIPAAGRPVVEPVDIEELRGEDGILTVARPGDEFVSIDGKRTYFNLFPDEMQAVGPTPFPSPVASPSSLPYHVQQPQQDQLLEEEKLPTATTKEVPRPGTQVSVPRPVVPQKPVTPVKPVAPPKVPKPVDAPRDEKAGIGTFEIEEPPVRGPISFKPKPKPSVAKEDTPLRIDTCQEGDDSTCETGETCRSDNFGASCVCRTGWGRKNPRLSCVELVNLALSIRIDRLSGKQLTFSKDYANPLSTGYAELSQETKAAMDSLLTRSLLPLYIGSDVNGFSEHKGRLATNVTVHFEASPITTNPSFRNELSRQLVNTIEGFSNRLGSSQLFVEGTQSPVISIQDIDECQSSNMNDCSSNATCKNNLGSFECTCKLGFVDKKDIDPRMVGRFCIPATCSNDYCNKRGECRMEGAQKVCTCRGTFGGAQCDIDTEVVGVAAGASATAILIIIITLVGLCWWSKRWRRDQDSELGMPRYPAKVPGHMALALPYAPQYGRPPMPAPPYYMPAFIHPPADYELSSMHSHDILSQLSTLRRPIAPTLSLPPQLEARRRPEEEDGLVGAVRMWYRRLSRRKHPGSSNMSAVGIPAYPNPYMEHPISRPKRSGSVISHGKNRRAPPPPTQPPPPLIEFTEDRASLSSGLYDSIDDKQSLHT